MKYIDLSICEKFIFQYIQDNMASKEPAPMYGRETSGIKRLEAIFHLMQRSDYKGLLGKAAYMFCSVIDSHHFSNGNKRLAVSLLIFFLLVNNRSIHAPNMEVMRGELNKAFPKLKWQDVQSFSYPHEYFFYHLALIIADRSQKGKMTFTQEQEAVKNLLEVVVS
ncbi:type II toxin-antitoxin system death-on-curing family toxin [Patescibacteria group bacterium]|nr:type II toxin-antitoxin system death-on-curing family toxin [Patescibacteria group bacterium]